ncbi:MAG: RNA-binding protein, partial [Flavobacteriaceae bacterium]|nr:RNA-binding protein [Flavobacteriaceae bacterium]
MKFNGFTIILFLTIILSCENTNNNISTKKESKSTKATQSLTSFTKISSSHSGVNFNNTITHDLTTKSNLFDYDFFYNGSGVGIVDINNDNLPDLFFTGNQVPNKLYLNKGDFHFEDITESSKINQNKNWSNGVTFADINNDGWMDIYVSQGGPYDKELRNNLLLINQKNNTFKEQADSFGLDDSGISTQSAFFDFDKDGDLDCIVMNENDYFGTDPKQFYNILKNKKQLKNNSSHLYRNDNGSFTDITEKSGLLTPTFGLGL